MLLKDSRVRIIEASEYGALRNTCQRGVSSIVDVLSSGSQTASEARWLAGEGFVGAGAVEAGDG